MKKNLYSFLGFVALFCAVFFVFSPSEKASAEESVPEGLNELVDKYNLENVEFTDYDANKSTLNFDTVEEFEAFLKNEEKESIETPFMENPAELPGAPLITTFAASTTKTYTYKEYTGVSTITAYAKVTRSSKGIVTKVIVWSDQEGVAFPIAYTHIASDYNLNSTKKGGKGYAYGTKSYGVTVGGQGIAYKKSVTYTVPF
ncbi:hypothetical protein [Kurthia huakuii]|uniref:hypothetical protein n=1 Tax=Kurthia huakuii TaxID=1421019 RepID=UPI000495314E|nr:hypothetical protein [Kurthia huakuii]MBM7701080.1 hypothetical protein [Kurthia huakuii]